MATNNTSIKIDGLNELYRKLKVMGDELAAKSLVSAAWSANAIVVNAMKANIISNGSVRTGTLLKSIKRKKVIYNEDGVIFVVSGVDKNAKGVDAEGNDVIPRYYAHLVEKDKPFIQPAYESTKMEVVNKFVDVIQRKLAKFLKGK